MKPIAIPLDALLAATAAAGTADKRGLPEAQVIRLREAFQRSQRPNPFQPGELVTPRRDASVTGAGDPRIVLDTVLPVMPSFRTDACCGEQRFDMQVACVNEHGDIQTNWAVSWEWEPWSLPSAAAAGPDEPATAAVSAPPVPGPWTDSAPA